MRLVRLRLRNKGFGIRDIDGKRLFAEDGEPLGKGRTRISQMRGRRRGNVETVAGGDHRIG